MTGVASAEGVAKGAKYTLFGVATINSLVLQAPKGGYYSKVASIRERRLIEQIRYA